jgi:hypothetical protein
MKSGGKIKKSEKRKSFLTQTVVNSTIKDDVLFNTEILKSSQIRKNIYEEIENINLTINKYNEYSNDEKLEQYSFNQYLNGDAKEIVKPLYESIDTNYEFSSQNCNKKDHHDNNNNNNNKPKLIITEKRRYIDDNYYPPSFPIPSIISSGYLFNKLREKIETKTRNFLPPEPSIQETETVDNKNIILLEVKEDISIISTSILNNEITSSTNINEIKNLTLTETTIDTIGSTPTIYERRKIAAEKKEEELLHSPVKLKPLQSNDDDNSNNCRYKVVYFGGIFVRKNPTAKSLKTTTIIDANTIFSASTTHTDVDGILYVKCSNGSGWVPETVGDIRILLPLKPSKKIRS